jgi:hypothetical protein
MTTYLNLLQNPPTLKVVGTPREIKLDLVSCMCDNRYRWTIKKNSEGDFKIFTHGYAFRNWQTKNRKDDIEWEADNGNWDKVFSMINSGTSKIEQIKYR